MTRERTVLHSVNKDTGVFNPDPDSKRLLRHTYPLGKKGLDCITGRMTDT